MRRFTSILFTLAFVVTAMAQDVTVRTLDVMDEEDRDFETYAFLEDANQVAMYSKSIDFKPQKDAAVVKSQWAFLNPIENTIIKEAINYELDVEGVDRTMEDPDVFIQYHVFEKDYAEDDNYIHAFEDYEYEYPKKADLMSNIDDGTLVMNVVDAKTGESLWEGFAYNAYDSEVSLDKKRQGLRKAVDALVIELIVDKQSELGMGY